MYQLWERFQGAVAASELIEIFCWMLVIVAGLGLLFAFFSKDRRLLSFAAATPTMLPTLGLIGTFLGIFEGLMDFDPGDIDASVPPLLSGLKLAFISSIVGMALGVGVRLLLFFQPQQDAQEEIAEGQFFSVFRDIQENTRQSNRHLASLEDKFDEFATQIGDATVEQLVQALEGVIKDFNAKINEQFGENFKKLNAAVERLVEWQKNYAAEVESTRESLEEAKDSIAQSANAFEEMKSTIGEIAKPLQGVRELLAEINSQRQELTGSLDAFAKLKEDAEKSLPFIEERLTSLSVKLGEAIEKVQSQMTTFDQQMQEELKRAIELMGSHLGTISEELVKDYTPLTQSLRQLIEVSQRTPQR